MKVNVAKWQYWLGGISLVLTIVLAIAIIKYMDFIQGLGAYGYAGAFVISIFGGATVIAPVPMTPVVFALGSVLKPWGVGLAAGLGETLGCLTIYMTGLGGGAAFLKSSGKAHDAYMRMTGWMKRKGTVTLFVLSATVNPFYYPAALAAGALRYGVIKFTIINLIGKTIKGMTVAYAGYFGLLGLARLLGVVE